MSQSPFCHIRKLIARLVLRGDILQWWCKWKFSCLERILLRKMVEQSRVPVKESKLVEKRANSSQGARLRKIVFVADIMWEADQLLPELEKICPVETLDLRPALKTVQGLSSASIVLKTVGEFLRLPRCQEPDVVIFYVRGGLLSEEVFSLFRKQWSCPILGVNLDDKVNFWEYNVFAGNDDNYKKWIKYFDFSFTNSRIASVWYEQNSFPVFYAPPGFCLPSGLAEPGSNAYSYPVSFLGSKKLDREVIIRGIERYGIAVNLFGAGWRNSQWVDNPLEVFRRSQINLGMGLATANLTTMKARDFECPSVGACYLTTYNWELSDWWDIGKEILCYRNVEEAVEIISYYYARPEECLKIARAAFRRGTAEHTWEARFRKLFREMGFTV